MTIYSGRPFTPQQQAALDTTAHLAVHANAGAGKTGVLTERFVRILLEHPELSIDSVVAMTFTKKAAAEMKIRVQAILAGSSIPAEHRRRAQDLLASIGSARISTIHSFCSGLLQKYARTTGVDVTKGDLHERTARMLQQQALADTVSEALQSPTAEDVLSVIDDIGVTAFQSAVTSLLRSSEERIAVSTAASKYSDPYDAARAVHDSIRAVVRDEVFSATLVAREIANIDPIKFGVLGTTFDEALAVLDGRMSSKDPLRSVVSILSPILTNAGAVNGRKFSFKDVAKPALSTSVWETLKAWTSIDDVVHEVKHHQRVSRIVLDLAHNASIRYADEKRRRQVLDVDDMMALTVELLRDDETLQDIHRTVQWIMIDEFQDTNAVQYEIVRQLAPRLRGETTGPNVYIVGDDKQSIYGFRFADVRLFRAVTADIVEANRRERAETDGLVVLPESFRMSPNIVPIVNDICSKIFIQESEYDSDYVNLTGGRTTQAAQMTGSVEVLRQTILKSVSNDESEGDDPALQADLNEEYVVVARRIYEALQGTDPIYVEDSAETVRLVQPGDIAILCRTAPGIMSMATALREYGIPYRLTSGREFFSRPEVVDACMMIRYCLDRDDNLALLSVLRGPYFMVNDVAITQLIDPSSSDSYDERLRRQAKTDKQLRSVVDLLDACLRDFATLPASIALQRTLLRCGWYDTISEDRQRERIYANMEKVFDIIRTTERDLGASLRAVVTALSVPDDTDTESERSVATEHDAVRIMTFHSAKGLEFPVVVLANLNNSGGKPPIYTLGNIGVTWHLPQVEFPLDSESGVDIAGITRVCNTMTAQRRDRSEDRRLLYVGLTRAADHLIINLPRYLRKPKKADAEPEESSLRGIAALLRPWIDTMPPSVRRFDEMSTVIERWTPPSQQSRTVVDLRGIRAEAARLDVVNATDLLPPVLRVDEPEFRPDGDARPDHGPAYGTLIHAVLQDVLTSSQETSDDVDVLTEALRLHAPTSSVRDLAEHEIRRVLESQIVVTHRPYIQPEHIEQSLLVPLGDSVLQGTMDVVFPTDSTTFEVWDWKTTALSDSVSLQSAAQPYELQLAAYAYIVLTKSRQVQTVNCRLLFTKRAETGLNTSGGEWVYTTTFTRNDLERLQTLLTSALDTTIERRQRRSHQLQVTSSRNG